MCEPMPVKIWLTEKEQKAQPALATTLGRLFAERYGGDRASTDWRHLGRLAGFANRDVVLTRTQA